MPKKIQDTLKNWGVELNESTLSMFLGAIVVLIIGVLAYNYFRAAKPTTPTTKITDERTPGEAAKPGEVGTAQAAVALPASHVVVKGENLWVISEKYYRSGYNFVDIAKTNNLSNPGAIEPGQKLTIPKVAVRLPLTVIGAAEPQVTASRIEGASYTVVKGDDLWNIALRAYGYGYRWVDIAKLNKLVNPSLIHPGNKLTLPRP